MNEQCPKCQDTGTELYFSDSRGPCYGSRRCDCPAGARLDGRMAQLAQLGLQLRQKCNELNAQEQQNQ